MGERSQCKGGGAVRIDAKLKGVAGISGPGLLLSSCSTAAPIADGRGETLGIHLGPRALLQGAFEARWEQNRGDQGDRDEIESEAILVRAAFSGPSV